jgi:hypothetical protein
MVDGGQEFQGPYPWICNGTGECWRNVSKIDPSEWYVGNQKVEYCMSELVEERCSFHFSMPLIVAVIICNIGKVIAMAIIAFRLGDRPLITVGDAIDSFLHNNDGTTKDMCLTTWKDIKTMGWPLDPKPSVWLVAPKRWYSAASWTRWSVIVLL